MFTKRNTNTMKNYIKNHRGMGVRISTALVVVVMFVCLSYLYVINAKYVATDTAGNVIGANCFYFTSDYLNEVAYDGTTSEYIMYGWDGMSKKSFAFNIRNYDNPLLYNNEDQSVKYHFSYEVFGNDKDLVDVYVYKIIDGVETVELNGELNGGEDSYTSIPYKLSIISKDPSVPISHDITVLLKVNTVESPYYAELSTKVTLQYSPFTEIIAEQGFGVPEEGSNSRAYALTYYINTANEINNDELENTDISLATEEIHVVWNNAKLELNHYDRKLSDSFVMKTVEEVLMEYENLNDCKNTIIIDENNIGHLYFDALAYSSFKIVFHKRSGIEVSGDIWKNNLGEYLWDLTPASLENGNLVYAEVVE